GRDAGPRRAAAGPAGGDAVAAPGAGPGGGAATPGAPVAPGAAASARVSSTFRSDPLPSLAVGRAHDVLIHLDRFHEATRL
ncbi:hypothetical protein, partial [Streptomyces sp. NPDC048551]|uniref:hypothetical protein n=1 Tax=Streptomyces sp. NPDC048551 TaxID=3155758 RepID=UPI00342A38C0